MFRIAATNSISALTLTVITLSAVPAAAQMAPRSMALDHNGSVMIVDFNEQTIRYMHPKRSLSALTDQMSFAGRIQYEGAAEGVAYVYKRGCGAAPYTVRGGYDASIGAYVLVGAAPIREKGGCRVIGYTLDSPNARLVYKDIEDQAAYFGDI